jgi:RNA polymerase sigma factor (sigma-70 family)
MSRAPERASRFEQAVLPHLDAAYNLARWIVRDPVMASDVVQDACLRALQYFPSFRGEDDRAWLLRIVRNAALESLRKSVAGMEVSLGAGGGDGDDGGAEMDIPDAAPGPEAVVASRQELARLDTVLAAMPVELRECLVLCELERLSYKEIARVTEVPIGTVMSRLWRARRLLLQWQAAQTP